MTAIGVRFLSVLSEILFFVNMVRVVFSTIDLNLSELEYLADHLHPEECRKLTASLHFKSYMEPNALDQAERKVPKEIPCLRLLLHWNSQEGKGETHEAIEHRLRQMGRYDLADWLGKTVFHQLGQDLEHDLDNPLKEYQNVTEKKRDYTVVPTLQTVTQEDVSEWSAFDTICYAAIGGLAFTIIVVLSRVICIIVCDNVKKRRKKKIVDRVQYRQIENNDSSGSDSDDKFDIRDHNNKSFSA